MLNRKLIIYYSETIHLISAIFQAQMPTSVEEFDHPRGLCPYLCICKEGRLGVAALQVVTSSLTMFWAGAQEQHFYPSSLKFKLNIL